VAGKIRITENGPDLVKDYIPPCTSVLSHPKLISYHYQFDKFFNQLEVDVATILKKIHDKEQSNPLALTVKYISEPLLYFLSTTIQGFGWQVPVQPPVYMIGHIASCARVLRNAIDSCSGKAREELLNYFVEWCNIKQGEFEKMLLRTINFQYEHVEIQKSIDTMVYFSDVVSQLFSKLSSLEYIGKKKETSIFVKEQPTAKKSFLAD
jgi:hypothetical protein